MRIDKLSSLKQRLRRGADAFEFSALIQGVSTLDDQVSEPIEARADIVPTAPRKPSEPPAVAVIREELVCGQDDANGMKTNLPVSVTAPSRDAREPREDDHRSHLKAALETLSFRLNKGVNVFASDLRIGMIQDAGECLVQINETLELLQSVDPFGEISRNLGTCGAPPLGRSWPPTVWSVTEFADSPLSALLPPGSSDDTVRSIMNAAWGITPNTSTSSY